jgi:uncharacterized protein
VSVAGRAPLSASQLAAEVASLHAEVDALAGRLAAAHGAALRCRRGCAPCCDDDLTVFEVEAELIHRFLRASRELGPPHPAGRCAFLDAELGCRVYAVRPYVCRTQGLPLRWLEEDEASAEVVERRDVCPENDAGLDLLGLPADACWTIGPFEERLAALQARADGGRTKLARVALRDLAR